MAIDSPLAVCFVKREIFEFRRSLEQQHQPPDGGHGCSARNGGHQLSFHG
jgi:hypothetical protein